MDHRLPADTGRSPGTSSAASTSIAAFIVAFLAWFAIAFTGRYPEGLYNFNAGVLRFLARANAFFYLQTDQWPRFGFEQDPGYPIRVEIDPPLEHYSRAKTIFRLILGIPVMFMLYLFATLYPVASVIAWLHIVFTGRTSAGTHNVLTTGSPTSSGRPPTSC